MSLDSLERDHIIEAGAQFPAAEKYADMLEEAQRADLYEQDDTRETLTLERYTETAIAINDAVAYSIQQGSLEADMKDIVAMFIDEEPDVRLQQFARLLIDAPEQATNAAWQEAHPKSSNSSSEKAKGRALALSGSNYDHVLQDVIWDGRGTFNRVQLTSFISGALDGKSPRFARNKIAGATAEIAALEAFQMVPGIEDVQFTDAETDYNGTDITARYKSELVGVDTKFDVNRVVVEQQEKDLGEGPSRHFTIGIPDEAIDDLSLSQWGRERLVAGFTALLSGEVMGE